MSKRYLRSIVSDFQTLTASADIVPVDLPVNPLSHLILTILATKNVAADVTKLGNLLVDILAGVTDVSIRHRGENIIQGSLQDLTVLSGMITGRPPAVGGFSQADNAVQWVSILIPFSRVPYDHMEAFPATSRGNLRFYMTAGPASALWDAYSWGLEAVELIEDTPAQFLKYTTLTRALAAAGRQRMPLPIGNEILGCLLFDPENENIATQIYSFGKVKILKDNVEQYFAESNWESLRESMERRMPGYHLSWGHRHASAAADTDVGEELLIAGDRAPYQYGYLDFDPLKDGSYALDAKGVSALDLDLNADTGSNETVRIIPVELIQVGAR